MAGDPASLADRRPGKINERLEKWTASHLGELAMHHFARFCSCHRQARREVFSQERPAPHSVPWARAQYRLDRYVRPLAQHLNVLLDVERRHLSGTNHILVEAVQKSVTTFSIDAVDLDIQAVRWQGESVEFRVQEGGIKVYLARPLARGEQGALEVDYAVTAPRAGIYFVLPDVGYPQKTPQVWTQGQDDDSRYWFPCFDEPGAKVKAEMTVRAPAGFICTSNGALISEERGGEWWKFHWRAELPIPPYLITLTAVPFSEIKDSWRHRPVHYLVEKGREAEAQVSFGRTPEMMELFSRITGVDYPFEKYTQIAVAEFIMGGMENTSATTQTDLTLHGSELEEDFSSEDLVAHELAHQWFGDLVTCHTWAHGWLNESWATFMEAVWKEHAKGPDETQYFQYQDLQFYLSEDASLYRRPVVTNVYSDPAEIWDRHLYQKGGLILNMLRAELGVDDFWRGTQIYLQRHRGQTAETIDFQRAMEEACGRPLDWFFDQWLYHGGHPQFHVTYKWDEENKIAYVRIEQKQKEDRLTPLYKIHSVVQLFAGHDVSKEVRFKMEDRIKNIVVPMAEEPRAVRFDPDNHLLKTVEWDLPENMIEHQLQMAGDVVGKVWAMRSLAKKGSRRACAILGWSLLHDRFWGVRAEAAKALAEIRGEQAFSLLKEALNVERTARVRAAIAQALAHWKNDLAFAALKELAGPGEPLKVRSEALLGLGRTRHVKAFTELSQYLEEPSWRDLIRVSVCKAFGELRDDRAVPLLKAAVAYGTPIWARPAGLRALGSLALDSEELTDFVLDHLKDPFHAVRFAAIEALQGREAKKAIAALETLAHQSVDGHLKFAAHRAAAALRAGRERSKDHEFMKSEVERLAKENYVLKDRLDKFESLLEEWRGTRANPASHFKLKTLDKTETTKKSVRPLKKKLTDQQTKGTTGTPKTKRTPRPQKTGKR